MLDRRTMCLGAVGVISIWALNSANAAVPAILAAAAAITALAIAIGKGADAMNDAIEKGDRLWRTVASIPDRVEAQRLFENRQAKILSTERRVVSAFLINGAVIITANEYKLQPDERRWHECLIAMDHASSMLRQAVASFLENAIWFSESAQIFLSETPKMFESRIEILTKIQELYKIGRPTTQAEISEFGKLMASYDDLRVQSLKLATTLVSYARPPLDK